MPQLPENLVDRVLERLGQARRPDPTLEGLRVLYSAWCRRIPFDNVRKLIELRSAGPRMLPGSGAEDFFESWLKYGTGGTCWSGAGACHALLTSLGFDAGRGVGTMLIVPSLPPNHGTVVVAFARELYLVDCSMLHGEPLQLAENSAVTHRAWGVSCSRRDDRWHISWRPLNKVEGLVCRLESVAASAENFAAWYEATRSWSPFNYELCARINRGNAVIGTAFGHLVSLHGDGSVSREPIGHEERLRLLVESFGISEEIARRLPADIPTPPPPWSASAAEGDG